VIDFHGQIFDIAERSVLNCFIGAQREEAFDLIQPRAVRGDEVNVPARRSLGQLRFDANVLVDAAVVDDQVDVQPHPDCRINAARKLLVTWLAAGEHGAVEHIECGKGCGRSVVLAVMHEAPHVI
jgi:hypothetical protein